MKVEEIRSEFKVIMVDRDFQSSHSFCEAIQAIGYQAHFYPTLDSGLLAVRKLNPHILILNYVFEDAEADQFLRQLRKLSPEIKIILLASHQQSMNVLAKVASREIYDYLIVPATSPSELVAKVDRLALQLYLGFENEQLRKRRGFDEKSTLDLDFQEAPDAASIENLESVQSFFRQSSTIIDQEQLIQKHILQVSQLAGNMPALYFRFLPQQMSFVHHHSVWLQPEQLRQVGFHVESFESSALTCLRDTPKNFLPLKEFVEHIFQISEFEAYTQVIQKEIRGLVLVLNRVVDPVKILKLQIYHEIFQAQFNANERLKENHSLQTHDTTTGLLNRKTFIEKTNHEVSRARRIEQPVSMMILEIDHFASLVKKYGEANMQLLVKALAKSIQKNFRSIDILARTQINEFSILLPHTDLKCSAIKAEKMRRAFASSRLPFVGDVDRDQFTLSIGVSEYPSLSSDSESLFRSADDALEKVKSKNGNSVLTWQAEDHFTPDFVPMAREKLSDDAASK